MTNDDPDPRDALLLAMADLVLRLAVESPTTEREERMRVEGLVREVKRGR